MHRLADLTFILAPTLRSRAYLQLCAAAGILPTNILFLPGEFRGQADEDVTFSFSDEPARITFRPGQPCEGLARALGIQTSLLPQADINHPDCVSAITAHPVGRMVYSGAAGVLLGKSVLASGKRFLHVHGGYLPRFRGSTAFYYSLLQDGTIGASALWLDEGIDSGPIVARRRFVPAHGVNIDYIQDPIARACVLVDVLTHLVDFGRYPEVALAGEQDAVTYNVIHPVLKHVALARVGLLQHSE